MKPTASAILEAVAEHGSVAAAAAALQVEPETVVAALRTVARKLDDKPRPAAQRSLFDAPPARPAPAPTPPTSGRFSHLVLFTDGAARGNPGPAGAGAVLSLPDGTVVARLGKFLGIQTNNVAEYQGLLIGLEKAHELGARTLDVRADSLLVISQLRGEWKVKHPGLKPYFDQARALLRKFERVSLEHVRRELNADADEMSNRAIDERM